MAYQVSLRRSAEKELDAFQANTRNRIIKHLLALEGNPRPSGIKKLQGEESYRLRVGNIEYCTQLMIKQSRCSFWQLDIAAKSIDKTTIFLNWMSDQIHRDAILNPNAVEIGVGYAYVASTAHGGYYTVVFGSP